MKPGWYKSRWVNVALHVAFWTLFFLVPYLLQPSFQRSGDHAPRPRPEADTFNIVKCIFWMAVFYFNAYVLVPKLAYARKYFFYFAWLLLLLALLSAVE